MRLPVGGVCRNRADPNARGHCKVRRMTPMATKPDSSSSGAARHALRYEVGGHVVRVTQIAVGRWAMAIDDVDVDGTYGTRAEAWEAGIREADKRDRASTSP